MLIKFKAASADEMCDFLCCASQRSALVGHSGLPRRIMLTLCTRYDWVSTLHWEGAKQSLEQLIEAESTPLSQSAAIPRPVAERTRRVGQLCLLWLASRAACHRKRLVGMRRHGSARRAARPRCSRSTQTAEEPQRPQYAYANARASFASRRFRGAHPPLRAGWVAVVPTATKGLQRLQRAAHAGVFWTDYRFGRTPPACALACASARKPRQGAARAAVRAGGRQA